MKKSKSMPVSKAVASGIPVFCDHSRIVPIAELKPNPRNYNRHPDAQIALLAKNIQHLGWRHPITVSTRSGFIVSGHGRLMSAKLLNVSEVPVDFQHFDSEAAEYAVLIADNRLAELAETDKGVLKELMSDLDGILGLKDIELTGFTKKDMESLIGTSDAATSSRLDRAPDLEKETLSKVGDIFVIQNGPRAHIVICGDSTDKGHLEIFKTRPADLVFTDPPYGVSYVSKVQGSIKNDELRDDALAQMLRGALEVCKLAAADHAAFYIWHASSTRRDFEWALQAVGLEEKQYLMWVKDSFTLGHADYHWQTEPCFYAQKIGGKAQFFGGRAQSTSWRIGGVQRTESCVSIVNGIRVSMADGKEILIQNKVPKNCKKIRLIRLDRGGALLLVDDDSTTDAWEVSRDPRSELVHPTQKPIALACRAIRNSTKPGELVFDCFGGSGSTAIACEHSGRDSVTIELDPCYVDVILKRFLHSYPLCLVLQQSGGNTTRVTLPDFPQSEGPAAS